MVAIDYKVSWQTAS